MAESSYQLRAHGWLPKSRFQRWWDNIQGWYQMVPSVSPSAQGKGSWWVGSERGSTDRPSSLHELFSCSLNSCHRRGREGCRAGQVQPGFTPIRKHWEDANLLLCSKGLEFSFKDMQMVYFKSPSLSSFPLSFRAEKHSFKFLLLFETEWENSTQNTLIWKRVTHCGEMKGGLTLYYIVFF